ncbi:MAG TPA: hypothetical protein VGK54_19160 [Chloroflexota bacterium]
MNQVRPESRAIAPPGLIDTLQAGFDTVNRNLWVLALPIAIDVFFWLGPQLTLGSVADWLGQTGPSSFTGGLLARTLGSQAAAAVPTIPSYYNLFWLLSLPLIGIPSFKAGDPGTGPTVPVDSAFGGAFVLLILTLAGLSVAALFYGLLAQAVRSGRAGVISLLPQLGQLWVNLIALFLLAGAAFAGLAILGALALRGLGSVAPYLGTAAASVFLALLLWGFIYLFFTTDALFVGMVGPWQAVTSSAGLVRKNFWSTLGFIALVLVIGAGFTVILHTVAQGLMPGGTAVAILGHIYISSGLVAASMTYYKERLDSPSLPSMR